MLVAVTLLTIISLRSHFKFSMLASISIISFSRNLRGSESQSGDWLEIELERGGVSLQKAQRN